MSELRPSLFGKPYLVNHGSVDLITCKTQDCSAVCGSSMSSNNRLLIGSQAQVCYCCFHFSLFYFRCMNHIYKGFFPSTRGNQVRESLIFVLYAHRPCLSCLILTKIPLYNKIRSFGARGIV